jgi:hypothetical protein
MSEVNHAHGNRYPFAAPLRLQAASLIDEFGSEIQACIINDIDEGVAERLLVSRLRSLLEDCSQSFTQSRMTAAAVVSKIGWNPDRRHSPSLASRNLAHVSAER